MDIKINSQVPVIPSITKMGQFLPKQKIQLRFNNIIIVFNQWYILQNPNIV